MSLERISSIVQGRSSLAEELAVRERELVAELDKNIERQAKLRVWLSALKEERLLEDYNITIERVDAIPVFSIRERIRIAEVSDIITRTFEELFKKGLQPAGPVTCLYHDEDFNPEDVDYEVCIPVATSEKASRTLPACDVAALIHIGPWDKVGKAYQALYSWLNEQGRKAVGPYRESYLVSFAQNVPPEQYQTKIMVPIG